MNDIAPAKNLNVKTPIDVQTPNGVIQFIPFQINRGHGNQKWVVSIDGFCAVEPPVAAQCYVFYKGAEIGSSFKSVSQDKHGWRASLETIISNPEFWGEQ